MASYAPQISSRRTFAIISHPDAGKTTLTEKLLLYTGTIQSAGSVKGKQNSRHAVSDWMDIEKQRGISVTSSVLQFTYGGCCVNILDTPGHQDFSEDTYRTLMAADAAVMVIDGAKGVEAQTKKLFRVCAMRGIPIFTFVNKMDRETRDPFDLMEEVENVLGIRTYPMNWPIGNGRDFRGVFDRASRTFLAFEGDGRRQRHQEGGRGRGHARRRRPERAHRRAQPQQPDGRHRAARRRRLRVRPRCGAHRQARPCSSAPPSPTSVWSPSSRTSCVWPPAPARIPTRSPASPWSPRARTSPASSSRSRRTWTRTIATESPSCASAPASSSAAWRQRTCRAVGRSNSPRVRP